MSYLRKCPAWNDYKYRYVEGSNSLGQNEFIHETVSHSLNYLSPNVQTCTDNWKSLGKN